jgi:hypothetical protein
VGEADGLTERLARLMPEGLVVVPEGLVAVPEGLVAVPEGLVAAVAEGLVAAVADAEAEADDRDGVGRTVEAAVVGRGVCSAGDVAGLKVATDSIAPATRHTARMLASSGMTLPCAAKGPASRRSRFLRRFARSSRW